MVPPQGESFISASVGANKEQKEKQPAKAAAMAPCAEIHHQNQLITCGQSQTTPSNITSD